MITSPVYEEVVHNVAKYLADYPPGLWLFLWIITVLIMALVIVGIGWLIANFISDRII